MKDILHIINSVVEHLQKLQKLEVISCDSDAKDIFAALKNELEEMQGKAALLIEENTGHKKEIHQLKAQIAGEHGFDVKYNVYYTSDGDGPFCPFCYEKRGRKIRLRRDTSGDDSTISHVCRVCEKRFGD